MTPVWPGEIFTEWKVQKKQPMEMDGYAINVIFIILLDILSSVSMIRLYFDTNRVFTVVSTF